LKAGGLDEAFPNAYNDEDYCLRVRALGLPNLWTPFATLVHHESKSRGLEDTPEKKARFADEKRRLSERWGDALLNDPAYNPNLSLDAEDFSLAWPPRVRKPWF
jgi:GT2 family glycosyltransferase